MVDENKGIRDVLKSMKAIRDALNNFSESTIKEWYRTANLPIRKQGGIWIASRKRIEEWWEKFSS